MPPKKRLGELLIDAGVIDEFQLRSALSDQKRWGDRLGATLVKLGFVTEEIMAKALSSQLKLPNVNLRTTEISPAVYSLITGEKAKKLGLIPVMVKKEGSKNVLYIAMSDPTNLGAVDELQFATGHIVKPVIAMDSQIQVAINRYYFGQYDEEENAKAATAIPHAAPPPMAESMEIQRGGSELYGKYGGEKPGGGAPEPAAGADRPRPSKEMLALLRLLTKKGIITKEEFIEEFKNM